MLKGVQRAFVKLKHYVKYDLREIVAPTSLPNPPDFVPEKWPLRRYWMVLRVGTKEYIDTWKRQPEENPEEKDTKGTEASPSGRPPIADDFAAMARGGANTIKPYLQELYRSRASMFRNASQSFIDGYREGYAGVEAEGQGPQAPQAPGPKAAQAQVPEAAQARVPEASQPQDPEAVQAQGPEASQAQSPEAAQAQGPEAAQEQPVSGKVADTDQASKGTS